MFNLTAGGYREEEEERRRGGGGGGKEADKQAAFHVERLKMGRIYAV